MKKLVILFTVCLAIVMLSSTVFAQVNQINGDITPNRVQQVISKIELKNTNGQYITIFSGSQTVDFASANSLPINQPNVVAGNYVAVRITGSRNITYYLNNINDTTSSGPWYSNSVGPNGSVYATTTGPAVAVVSPLTAANGSQDITVGSTTIHLVFDTDSFTYEIPLSSAIVVTANANSNINLKFQLTNMMFVETYDTTSGLGVVSSNPPLLTN